MMNGGSQFAEGYAIGRDTNNNGNGMWGNDAWWIIVLLLFGYGRNGFGGGFGGGGYYPNPATQADLSAAFASNTLQRGIDDILLAQNSNFANVQQTLCQGFNGINTSILQSANATERGFAQVGYNLAQCCCDTKAAIADVKYANEKQTCDIINAINAGNQRLMDWQVNEKIDALNRKLAVAENEALTLKNNAYLINSIKTPCPIPAYTVPNPNCCYPQYNTCNNGIGII